MASSIVHADGVTNQCWVSVPNGVIRHVCPRLHWSFQGVVDQGQIYR